MFGGVCQAVCVQQLAKFSEKAKRIGHRWGDVAILCFMTTALSSCFGSGMELGLGSGPDKQIETSSVPGQYHAQPDGLADETTVRNAVTSADMSRIDLSGTIPWANTSTGSAGVISHIQEENNGSYVCRTFMTTRHSYQGVSNYIGKACLIGSGTWQLVSFKDVG